MAVGLLFGYRRSGRHPICRARFGLHTRFVLSCRT